MLSTSASDNPSRPDPEDHDPGNLDEGEPSSLRGWARILLAVMVWLPKNALSRLAGRFASLQLPGVLQRAEIAAFARLADVNLDEARDPIESYVSLQRFFVRALRDDARPLEGGETSLIAPCDGAWGAAGRVEAGTILQVKGRNYSVAELLGDEERAASYEAGHYATFYLSPRDYHRFHTPTAGRITRVDYRPGALWPVNSIGLNGVEIPPVLTVQSVPSGPKGP
jgi:phosphatidylserine decarboxylase